MARSDRSLARELGLGVVRRRETLRTIIKAFLRKPQRKLPAPVEEILMVGLYQLLFLERVPDFAAVNEAVNQAARFGHRRQSGLVNGLLRGVGRALSDVISGRPPLADDVVPVGSDSYRKFDRPVFSDPRSRPTEYLSEAFSLPERLTERWMAREGSLEAVADLGMHADVRAPLIFRVNRLRAGVQEVLASLESEGAEAREHHNAQSVVTVTRVSPTELETFRKGWVQPQDPSATEVVAAAAPAPGMKVLDFCAAPGTKTTHLAELMDNTGSITAADVSEEKLARIESNCRRMGISIVETILSDRVGSLEPGSFDLALVDAPCSNTGVFSRRPEARWRFDPRDLEKLSRDQRFLIAAAARFVRRGGRLVYSTCSIEPEECAEVVHASSRPGKGLRLIRDELMLPAGAGDPTGWRDGGYYAILEIM